MAFDNSVLENVQGLANGEVVNKKLANIEAFDTFENGLKIGRFAKFDTGSIDNVDGSATPLISGIVTREIGYVLGDTIYADANSDSPSKTVAPILTTGFAVVEVVDGDTPTQYGDVFVNNTTEADYGKATTTSTSNVAVNWVFWKQNDTNSWLVAKKELVK